MNASAPLRPSRDASQPEDLSAIYALATQLVSQQFGGSPLGTRQLDALAAGTAQQLDAAAEIVRRDLQQTGAMPPTTSFKNAALPILCASLLTAAGHPEWVALTMDEYIQTALQLASDRSSLQRIQQHLRQELEQSLLMDRQQYCASFQQTCRRLWQDKGDYTL